MAEITHLVPPPVHYCHFCMKTEHEVKQIIKGRMSAICDECIEQFVALLLPAIKR
jgi:ATP-dependent protease Clp ATPase subunit